MTAFHSLSQYGSPLSYYRFTFLLNFSQTSQRNQNDRRIERRYKQSEQKGGSVCQIHSCVCGSSTDQALVDWVGSPRPPAPPASRQVWLASLMSLVCWDHGGLLFPLPQKYSFSFDFSRLEDVCPCWTRWWSSSLGAGVSLCIYTRCRD